MIIIIIWTAKASAVRHKLNIVLVFNLTYEVRLKPWYTTVRMKR